MKKTPLLILESSRNWEIFLNKDAVIIFWACNSGVEKVPIALKLSYNHLKSRKIRLRYTAYAHCVLNPHKAGLLPGAANGPIARK